MIIDLQRPFCFKRTRPGSQGGQAGTRLLSDACRTVDPSSSRNLSPTGTRPTGVGCIPSSRCQNNPPPRVLPKGKNPDRRNSSVRCATLSDQTARLKHQDPGGARRDRTDDLMLAKHALSQLSYGPLVSARQDQGSWRQPQAPARPCGRLARGPWGPAASRPCALTGVTRDGGPGTT